MKSETIGNLTFYNADNIEIMRGMNDNEFDLAIVDKINMILLLLYQSILSEGWRPFETKARYFSDFIRNKEWFYEI